MDRLGLRLDVRWAPRDLNQEADDLSNGKVENFNAAHRVEVDVRESSWLVLNELMKFGQDFEKERNRARKKRLRDARTFLRK